MTDLREHRVAKTAFPAKDKRTVRLFVADDTAKAKFNRAVLRIETVQDAGTHRMRLGTGA